MSLLIKNFKKCNNSARTNSKLWVVVFPPHLPPSPKLTNYNIKNKSESEVCSRSFAAAGIFSPFRMCLFSFPSLSACGSVWWNSDMFFPSKESLGWQITYTKLINGVAFFFFFITHPGQLVFVLPLEESWVAQDMFIKEKMYTEKKSIYYIKLNSESALSMVKYLIRKTILFHFSVISLVRTLSKQNNQNPKHINYF